jgi:hypothetical protein
MAKGGIINKKKRSIERKSRTKDETFSGDFKI